MACDSRVLQRREREAAAAGCSKDRTCDCHARGEHCQCNGGSHQGHCGDQQGAGCVGGAEQPSCQPDARPATSGSLIQVVVLVRAPQWQHDTIITRLADSVKWLDDVEVVAVEEVAEGGSLL